MSNPGYSEWQFQDLVNEATRFRAVLEWVAGHRLVQGVYADDDHPYKEWVTPDGGEMEFDEVRQRVMDALRESR